MTGEGIFELFNGLILVSYLICPFISDGRVSVRVVVVDAVPVVMVDMVEGAAKKELEAGNNESGVLTSA